MTYTNGTTRWEVRFWPAEFVDTWWIVEKTDTDERWYAEAFYTEADAQAALDDLAKKNGWERTE